MTTSSLHAKDASTRAAGADPTAAAKQPFRNFLLLVTWFPSHFFSVLLYTAQQKAFGSEKQRSTSGMLNLDAQMVWNLTPEFNVCNWSRMAPTASGSVTLLHAASSLISEPDRICPAY